MNPGGGSSTVFDEPGGGEGPSPTGGWRQKLFEWPCKPDRLRIAHPCALLRSTVHPVHKRVLEGLTHLQGFGTLLRPLFKKFVPNQ